MRVIVTGSREWINGAFLRARLDEVLEGVERDGSTLTVVHGGCRSGADQYADGWTRWHSKNGYPVNRAEVHVAQWEAPCRDTCRAGHRRPDPRGWDVCPQAGFYRNELMVNLGAALCLAFIADSSKGATHCATYAFNAGIETRAYDPTGAPIRLGAGADVLF